MRVLILSLFLLSGCSSFKDHHRDPSSTANFNPCTHAISAFFDENAKKQVGLLSENELIAKGLLSPGELKGHLTDPVYRNLILSEDEALREDTAKIIGLIRRYRPDYNPKQVADLYHELFHSCKL